MDNEKFVVTKDAYLLFYRRRGMPAVINSPDISDVILPNSTTDQRSHEASAFISEKTMRSGIQTQDEGMQTFLSSQTRTSNAAFSQVHNINHNNAKRPEPHLPASAQQGAQLVPDDSHFGRENDNPHDHDLGATIEDAGPGNCKAVELEEKGDREKEFYDCEDDTGSSLYSDDSEPRLVIQTDNDLGYTDMEAVD